MRKMKKLFRIREFFVPWLHWSIIHSVFNAVNTIALFICIFVIENKAALLYLLYACVLQWIPIFLIQIIDLFFKRKLSKNALAIIMRKLEESKVNFKDIDISIKQHTLYYCTINVNRGITNTKQLNEFVNILHDINRKFGNNYYIKFIVKSI